GPRYRSGARPRGAARHRGRGRVEASRRPEHRPRRPEGTGAANGRPTGPRAGPLRRDAPGGTNRATGPQPRATVPARGWRNRSHTPLLPRGDGVLTEKYHGDRIAGLVELH